MPEKIKSGLNRHFSQQLAAILIQRAPVPPRAFGPVKTNKNDKKTNKDRHFGALGPPGPPRRVEHDPVIPLWDAACWLSSDPVPNTFR